MTDEIIFEKLPNGFALAKKLTRLRSFIEHQLLTMTTRDWVLNQKDPTWQALCHYYAMVIDLNLLNNRAHAPLQPCVAAISSGALIVDFQYPFSWAISNTCEALEPCMVFASITDCIHFYGNPQGGGGFPLPLTGFDQHMAKTKPSNSIHLVMKRTINGDNVITLDDGRFLSGIRPGNSLPDLTHKIEYALLTRRVWKRWFRDSVQGIGLRDVVAPEGHVIFPKTAMVDLIQVQTLNCEHCYLVLSAVANGLWDSKFAEFAIARLLCVETKSPNTIDRFVKALPGAVADLLPPVLKAYRL